MQLGGAISRICCCFKDKSDVKMGSVHSKKDVHPPFVELPKATNLRTSLRSNGIPMPDQHELDIRFAKVLASMNLPPDKAKILKQYDNERKWVIICDQDRVQAKDPPSHYLSKLRTYLDPKASRSSRKRKMVGDATSTQVLRDLEISLRTNHIEWVREFLNNENHGLDSLIEYLSFRLVMLHHEYFTNESRNASEENFTSASGGGGGVGGGGGGGGGCGSGSSNNCSNGNGILSHNMGTASRPSLELMGSPNIRRQSKHIAKLNMGDTKDDIHVCIMCLRAIMNNKYGFSMVIKHREAINSIALSLIHKSLRTKASVLELLAAICLVKGGHEIILSAFDNFKDVFQEKRRFQTLMEYFKDYEVFHLEFMVSCMQFVNIVVHSVEDMNFRVHLQYEFTKLGLDDYLNKLIQVTESAELKVQISAYLDNEFHVAALMEDSETKTIALEKVAELEDELAQAHDRFTDLEAQSMAQMAALESALNTARLERDEMAESKRAVEEEMSTLRRAVNDQTQESRSRQSLLEEKIQELIRQSSPESSSSGVSSCASTSSSTCSNVGALTGKLEAPAAPPPPPPPPMPKVGSPAAPPPPPPPMGNGKGGAFCLPPFPGMMQAPDGAMTIKRKIQTKYKLPTLNWVAMKPNQVPGTIFNELDDDSLHSVIDFGDFEEKFKLSGGKLVSNGGVSEVDGLSTFPSKRFKKTDAISMMEHTRLRNIAISRRKIDLPVEKVILGVNSLDLKQISLEYVEILQRMIPTEQEVKAYKEYFNERKDINLLTEEDKFLYHFSRVERLQTKLAIMNYMGNFLENVKLLEPQVHAIISSSIAVKNSKKLRKILEIVLAFGNYMNSGKRGPAYGFKLQSLDSLVETKCSDKRMCLLHYIADTVRAKFPELLNFDSELTFVDKAATVSLDNVLMDVCELEKNMEMVRKEYEMRVKEKQAQAQNVTILREFLAGNEDKLKRLRADTKVARDAFQESAEYFGEAPSTTDANTFFSLFVRFARSFKTADQENEQRRKLVAQQMESLKRGNAITKPGGKYNQKRQQDAVINELKNKVQLVQEKKLLHQDEVYNGALEDILLGLKNEPYRRADAVRRSQRRKIDNNRLSKTLEDLEV